MQRIAPKFGSSAVVLAFFPIRECPVLARGPTCGRRSAGDHAQKDPVFADKVMIKRGTNMHYRKAGDGKTN